MSLNKKKLCDGCHEEKFIWKNHEGNKYCVGCWNKIKPQPVKPVKQVKSVKKISDKRKLENKEYSIERVEFLLRNSICQARIRYICSYDSTQVHHMAGRVGTLFLDKDNWLAVCHECHQWIELHPNEAKELGFSKSRL